MKILVIEDELQTAEVLKDIILHIRPGAEVVEIIDSIENSVKFLSMPKNQVDLIFMDIHLADGLSFEIFTQVKIDSPVIFCTAYDQYALQAFRANGIEYILKPVSEEDIRKAFEKVDNLRQSLNAEKDILSIVKEAFPVQKNYRGAFLVEQGDSFVPIAIQSVALFALADEKVFAYCFDNRQYTIPKSMEEIELNLNPSQFYRINRQIILNRDAIKGIKHYFNRKIIISATIRTHEQLIVSRLKVSAFLRWIEKP